MKGQTNWLMLGVVVVTFIAGYSIVSFVVRKWKEGPGRPSLDKQVPPGSNPTREDMSKSNPQTADAHQRSPQDDQ